MHRIRVCEESFVDPINAGEIRCPVHLCSGQEAVAVGVCGVLSTRDFVFGTHRSHGHYLAKGGDLRRMVAEVYCRETGCARGRGGSMHLVDPAVGMLGAAPIVAGTISLSLGAALACAARRDGSVSVAFFGDGAVGEGVLFESLNFASLRRLPIVFVCENNLYSTHLGIADCRVDDTIHDVAAPFRMSHSAVDGNDVLAVRHATIAALGRARDGAGPTFLECKTYRLRGHVGPDDNIQGTRTDIRPPAEIEAWRARDPIVRLRQLLLERGLATVDQLERVELASEREVREAHDFARTSEFPSPNDLSKFVLAGPARSQDDR
jgi:pyruvate dehydrogenase E1 component alpha subunit